MITICAHILNFPSYCWSSKRLFVFFSLLLDSIWEWERGDGKSNFKISINFRIVIAIKVVENELCAVIQMKCPSKRKPTCLPPFGCSVWYFWFMQIRYFLTVIAPISRNNCSFVWNGCVCAFIRMRRKAHHGTRIKIIIMTVWLFWDVK